jgi:GWxTD domain-containing protein
MINNKYKKLIFVSIFIPFLTGFCSKNYYSTKNLSPEKRAFISEVRYIITKSEKKKFFSLVTEEERTLFIENFWKKRDPDLSTEENEFKILYYDRIEKATHLFKDESKEGWLTDRGRVYILLGPPEHRRFRPGEIGTEAAARSWYQHPYEIWYYGFYPIIFVDRMENGRFELSPLGAQHVSTILRTSMDLKPTVGKEKIPYNFTIKLNKEKDDQLELQVNIPYENILFQQTKNRFTATLTLHVNISDTDDKKIQNFSKEYIVSLTEEELKAVKEPYVIKAPFTLKPGKYHLQAILESKEDDIRTTKKIKFRI